MNTPQEFLALPGVPGEVEDFMGGEDRETGTVVPVPGWISWNDARKLRWLRDFAERYGNDPHMRWFTVEVLRSCSVNPRDYEGQAACLLRYVQNLYYTNEPGEQVQSPWRTIQVQTGDCDDLGILLASMAESIALPWRWALAGKNTWTGQMIRHIEGEWIPFNADFQHIYLQLGWPPFTPQVWRSAEPTVRGAPLGYDVVEHGLPKQGPNGTALLPELGLGNTEFWSPDTSLPWYKRISWDRVLESVISGVLVAVSVALVLPIVERQRRKR